MDRRGPMPGLQQTILVVEEEVHADTQTSHSPDRSADLTPNQDLDPNWYEALLQTRIGVLRKVASFAKIIALNQGGFDDNQFKLLIKFASDQRIVAADEVGAMGNVDRTTASRWINGHTTPNSIVQREVLSRISQKAAEMANALVSTLKVTAPDESGVVRGSPTKKRRGNVGDCRKSQTIQAAQDAPPERPD